MYKRIYALRETSYRISFDMTTKRGGVQPSAGRQAGKQNESEGAQSLVLAARVSLPCGLRGNLMVKVVPSLTLLCTEILPPCLSMIP